MLNSSHLGADPTHLGVGDGMEYEGDGGFELPSLEEMVDHAKYHSYTLTGPGNVGCTLRHFCISQMGVAKVSTGGCGALSNCPIRN